MTAKTVSLVLGSGGARGLAHIGAIRYLKEEGYEIRSVSGCSIGASIGGVLKDLVGDRLIEDLPIEYTAVAADIQREKEIWLKRGSLFSAIRASISLPLFFTPYEIDGMKLLDGGILNPVPIAPTFEDGTDLTIAINLGATPTGRSNHPRKTQPVAAAKPQDDSVHAMINSFIEKLTQREPPVKAGSWKMLGIADQTFDAMQSAIARQKLAAYPPDHTILIPRDACGTLEFDRADEMISLGYETTAASLA